MKLKRIVIYPKDIQLITGKSERYGRTLIHKMKSHFEKEEHQLISIDEFCKYMGLQKNEVEALLHN